MDEIDQLSDFINDPVISPLIKLGAKCSARLCEAYGIRQKQINGSDVLKIDNQLLPDGTRKLPKRDKERLSFVIQDGMDAVKEWIHLSDDLKEDYRKGKKKIPQTIKRACQKLWEHDKTKHLNFRDLRHCYAVHLISIGVSLETVADYMGNTPEVCRIYYKGHMVHDLAIQGTRLLATNFEKKGK